MYRSLEAASRKARQFYPTVRISWVGQLSRCTSTTSFSPNASLQNEEEKRFNPLEIQMLSKSLHDQVFHGKIDTYDPAVVKKCQEHLKVCIVFFGPSNYFFGSFQVFFWEPYNNFFLFVFSSIKRVQPRYQKSLETHVIGK